ncbi:Oidioi.mRNA.OKI2018_I69.XSR.g16611.t1.cds [Oikopleura dioica]|uniref:Oidioi.mRNA.OKI2018_I69.XSR.g16611.t1.cds n=1 Tax=Oikopleura dioica TaxID=34765 RepID=A0ABN7SLH9_OIKDI|nr:Oidioi.mRNA.OKI2018_I69.XSR.g16611.t1.cds [Oikopleura dioica]
MASKGHSLAEILEAFNSPLKFDQAWALIHVYLSQVQDDPLWPMFNNLSEVSVHPDGAISSSHDLKRTSSETDFLEAFGRLIYNALDYGYGEDDEPDLPEDLERLITFMTGTVDSDPEDDGYSEKTMTIKAVLKHCRIRAGSGFSEHYTKVVKAFYFEALELMEFLSKISTANESLKSLNADPSESEIQELEAMGRKHWSSAWGEVMLDLRHGVPLKHIQENQAPAPARFEFTPYEMLLSDIRKKTYKLKHVEAQETENTAKTTHDVILDFIRSRPPLAPASKRQLTPKPKSTNTHDNLMEEIRSGSVLKSVPMDLRPKPEESAIDSIKDIIRSESVGRKNAKKRS